MKYKNFLVGFVCGIIILSFIPKNKKYFHKENDFITIEGRQFPLVEDDYGNWYIKEQIGIGTYYFPTYEFETTKDEEQ